MYKINNRDEFLNAKKYQIEVGKKQERNVNIEEALDQIQENNGDVEEAIRKATNN